MTDALIPSPLVCPLQSLAVRTADPMTERQSVTVMLATLGWMWLRRRPAAHVGVYLNRWLSTRGVAGAKVAQVLSLRRDLFSADFCAAFTGSQGRAAALPATHARALVEQQLGRPCDAVFDVFHDPARFAASTGTIFIARLRDEQQWVAVKVQHPFAAQHFRADMQSLRRVAWVCSWLVPKWRLSEAVREVTRIVTEELDYRFEANAQMRMRRTLRKHRLYVPRVFLRYCTKTLLVTEWVEAVVMTDYLAYLDADPEGAAEWCGENQIVPDTVARTLLRSLFRQIFEDNRVHIDMHPGNLGLLVGGKIVVYDFGSTARTEREFLGTFYDQIRAIATGHFAWAADLCMLMCAGLPRRSWWLTRWRHARRMTEMKAALKMAMQTWSVRTEVAALDYHEKSLNACTLAMMQTVMRRGGAMQWEWLRLSRAMMTLDASLAKLAPTLDYPRLTRDYMQDAEARVPRCAPFEALARLFSRLPQFVELADRFPEYVRLKDQEIRQLAMPFGG